MKITPVNLAKRIEKWQQRLAPLGVAHFRFSVVLTDEMPDHPKAKMTVQVAQTYDDVTVWVRQDWLDEVDEDGLDETIIHEWIHVAMRDLDMALEAVESWMPEATYEDFEDRIDHEREGLVDRIARTMYKLHTSEIVPSSS